MKNKVLTELERIRPMLQSDGGDVQLVSVSTDGVVEVSLKGACKGCLGATMTLENIIKVALKNKIPEITNVVSV